MRKLRKAYGKKGWKFVLSAFIVLCLMTSCSKLIKEIKMEIACEEGDKEACLWVASNDLCNDGNMEGCHGLGALELTAGFKDMIKTGVPNLKKIKRSYSAALPYFDKACNGGYFFSCNTLGEIYGEGVAEGNMVFFEKDKAKAEKYFQKACDGGVAKGCSALGSMKEQSTAENKPKDAKPVVETASSQDIKDQKEEAKSKDTIDSATTPKEDSISTSPTAFSGGNFNIVCPAGFTVKPSLKSAIAGKHDSVFCVSPDGLVEFYAFASGWVSAEEDLSPQDISFNPTSEKQSSPEVKRIELVEITSYTITAKDGTYSRSYQKSVFGEEGTYRAEVIGLKYADKEAYEKHKKAYLEFKKSLEVALPD